MRGFTFLELVLVLLIISIASALVVPMIGSRLKSGDIRHTAVQLRAAMEFLRVSAVRHGREAVLVVDPETNSYWREPGGGTIAVPAESGVLSGQGHWIRDTGAVEFRFYPNGTNSGGEVRLEKRQGVALTAYVLSLDPLLGTATIRREE
jgi:general secretion pathway protein H